MKIKINREIEVPESLMCTGRRDCSALCRVLNNKGSYENYADCHNFNCSVFWSNVGAGGFIKAPACIDATLSYLHGVTK